MEIDAGDLRQLRDSDALLVPRTRYYSWLRYPGYYYASPCALGLASADDVDTCRQVVYHQHTSSDQAGR